MNKLLFTVFVLMQLILLTTGTIAEPAQFDTDITIVKEQNKLLEFSIPNTNEKLSVEVIPREDFICKVKFNGLAPSNESSINYPFGLEKPYVLFDWIVDEVKDYNVVFRYQYDRTRARQLGFEEDTMRFSSERVQNTFEVFGGVAPVSTRTKTITQGGSHREMPFRTTSLMIVGKEEEFLGFSTAKNVIANQRKIFTVRDQNTNRVGLKLHFLCTQNGQVSLTKEEALVSESTIPSNTIDLDGWIGFKLAETNQNSCTVKYEYDLYESGRVTKVNQILSDNRGKQIKAMVYVGSGSYSFLPTKREGDVIVFTQETKSQDSNSYVFIVANGKSIVDPIPTPKKSDTTDVDPIPGKPNEKNNSSSLKVNITLIFALVSLISFALL